MPSFDQVIKIQMDDAENIKSAPMMISIPSSSRNDPKDQTKSKNSRLTPSPSANLEQKLFKKVLSSEELHYEK